jgi:penicillin-binding protein 1C
VQTEVCSLSGLLPTDDCPYRRREWFIAGTQPVEADTFYKQVLVDGRTNLLADDSTPPDLQSAQLVLDLPPLFYPWARAEGLTLWSDLQQASDQAATVTQVPLRLTEPAPHTLFRLSPTLPSSAQKIRLEAIGQGAWQEVTIWVDDTAVATLEAPPYEVWWQLTPGQHNAWANGRDEQGNLLTSEPVSFTVNEVDDE